MVKVINSNTPRILSSRTRLWLMPDNSSPLLSPIPTKLDLARPPQALRGIKKWK
jgi:hypothetical protein